MHFVVYLLASLFLLSQTLHAREELIVIQAVSTSKQTFVINKGLKDGISKSTEALFSNKDVSLAARVVEASREHSLWQINDRRTTFPFEKNQIVTFNQESRNIWNEVPQVREKIEQAIVEAQHHQSVLGPIIVCRLKLP